MPNFDIASIIRELVLLVVPFLSAITVHEFAHGYAAYRLGDPTAKMAGRLTLNPLKHLDVMGTLVLVMTRMIGWAKPVPVDSRYFKDPVRGMMLVSVAGPAANFALAIAYALVLHLLDASGIALTRQNLMVLQPLSAILFLGVQINLVLGFFNLLPIPPMDGSNILAGFLPPGPRAQYLQIGAYGMFIILALAVTGALGYILSPLVTTGMAILL